jgi:hypothetical protein
MRGNAMKQKKIRVCLTIDPELHSSVQKMDQETQSGFSFHVSKALAMYLKSKTNEPLTKDDE